MGQTARLPDEMLQFPRGKDFNRMPQLAQQVLGAFRPIAVSPDFQNEVLELRQIHQVQPVDEPPPSEGMDSDLIFAAQNAGRCRDPVNDDILWMRAKHIAFRWLTKSGEPINEEVTAIMRELVVLMVLYRWNHIPIADRLLRRVDPHLPIWQFQDPEGFLSQSVLWYILNSFLPERGLGHVVEELRQDPEYQIHMGMLQDPSRVRTFIEVFPGIEQDDLADFRLWEGLQKRGLLSRYRGKGKGRKVKVREDESRAATWYDLHINQGMTHAQVADWEDEHHEKRRDGRTKNEVTTEGDVSQQLRRFRQKYPYLHGTNLRLL